MEGLLINVYINKYHSVLVWACGIARVWLEVARVSVSVPNTSSASAFNGANDCALVDALCHLVLAPVASIAVVNVVSSSSGRDFHRDGI